MLARFGIILILLYLVSVIPVSSKIFFLEADYYQDKTQDRKIVLGKGEIISSDKVITRVAISDPNIADAQVLSEKQIFLRAKHLGICTLLAWEKDKSIPTRFDVAVWPDIEYLTKQLQALDANILVDYIPPNSSLTSEDASSGESGGTEGGESPGGGGGGLFGASGSSNSSDESHNTSGKVILSGGVKNAEIIARALQIAGAYVGDQGIKIISQPGGQIVNGLAGSYDIHSNSDKENTQSQSGSAIAFGTRDPIKFTSNRYANLSRGVIATTQHGSVISFLTVKDPAQISVAIRFYEVSRNLARNLGYNLAAGGNTIQGGTFVGGNTISQVFGGIGTISNLMSFMAGDGGMAAEFTFQKGLSVAGGSHIAQNLGQGITGVIFNPDNGLGAIIQALQERGEIKSLAEPNLVIANGEPASFLAGGEVPIVRSVFTAGGASQDVTYEPFGVKFSILPTLIGDNNIFLQLAPEIRDIDTNLSNLIVPPGSTSIRPPAFRTRRTQTQVELESGQAFAISGLLREDNTRNLRKVPGIGDIPVLGSLFRSKSFSKGETELLIVVSPVIVRPGSPNKLAKLSKEDDVPYEDFNLIPQLRPFKQKNDEKGPDFNKPLEPGKMNDSQSFLDDTVQNTLGMKKKAMKPTKEKELLKAQTYEEEFIKNAKELENLYRAYELTKPQVKTKKLSLNKTN